MLIFCPFSFCVLVIFCILSHLDLYFASVVHSCFFPPSFFVLCIPCWFQVIAFALFFDLATSLFHLWFCYAFMVLPPIFHSLGSLIRFAYLYVFIISLLCFFGYLASLALSLGKLFLFLCSLGLLLCCFRLLQTASDCFPLH
jgi:hypothetical protein